MIEKPIYNQLPPENLIFISAQPGDHLRFLWELDVQMNNFVNSGIDPVNMHILLAYINKPLDIVLKFMEKHYKKFPNIFLYPDERPDGKTGKAYYQPSIRPHILKQHYHRNPWLSTVPVFYHDSDIIFSRLPDFNFLCGNDINYLSDTNSYLNATYIESKGEGLLEEMCGIVGVRVDEVRRHNFHSGGAQYLFKNLDSFFWEKVERDCVGLFRLMNETRSKYAKKWAEINNKEEKDYHEIQAWCADMWAIFYNLLFFSKPVEVTSELDFTWATDSNETFFKKPIYHNAGVTGDRKDLFYKGMFIDSTPFEFDLSFVNPQFASWHYAQEIEQVKKKNIEYSEV